MKLFEMNFLNNGSLTLTLCQSRNRVFTLSLISDGISYPSGPAFVMFKISFIYLFLFIFNANSFCT